MTNLDYTILHDTGQTLCLIGNSSTNTMLYRYFSTQREVIQLSYEELLDKTQTWFDSHQFIVTAASVQFKKTVVDGLSPFSPNYFSVVSNTSDIGFNVSIGRGTVIDNQNVLLDDTGVGDHTTISHFCLLSHGATVGSFCHVGPFAQFLYSCLGDGSYLAGRTSIVGTRAMPVTTADYCNYIINSTVTKNIDKSGTYFGNRCIDTATSLDKKID